MIYLKWLAVTSVCLLSFGCQSVVFSPVESLPLELPRTGHSATQVNDLVYLLGGVDGEGEPAEAQIMNLKTGAQQSLGLSLLPRVDHSAVFDGVSKIYLIGGQVCLRERCTLERRVEVLDLKTLKVSFAAPKPDPSIDAAAAYYDGEIYVFGGSVRYRGRKVAHSLGYALDVTANSWRRLAFAPTEEESAVVLRNGKFYLLGGYDHRNKMKHVEEYDPKSDTWRQLNDLPIALSGHEVLATDSDIYIFGDYDHPGSVYKYEFTSRDWIECGFYVKPARNLKVVGAGQTAYLIGGHMGRGLNVLDNFQRVDLRACN